jgi:hypothetical protein
MSIPLTVLEEGVHLTVFEEVVHLELSQPKFLVN